MKIHKNNIQTYAENDAQTIGSFKLISLLYEGILKFNSFALKAMKEKNIQDKVYYINRSIAIISELISILDMEAGNISFYLKGLYSYQIILLTEANIENNETKILESINVFKVFLNTWKEENNIPKIS